ncbi:sarcocystatin-A [Musca domestica]|uniref:Sarcocystatin-A n=1 Tax=Musca domestica TaxID=7370 RepID=A0A1I8MTB7_MUSDO|nr:sarcocystatin-A [Musca domestica]
MMKFLVVAFFAVLAIAKANEFCAGCVTTVTDDKGLERATNTLNNSLKKLAAGEGPHYKLVKINSATSQVIRGHLFRINADLEDENGHTKTCDIKIIEFTDVNITFNCPEEQEVSRTHSY